MGYFIPDDQEGFSDDGYEDYKQSKYDYARTNKTYNQNYAMEWQVDAGNIRNGPWKYKFEAIGDYVDDRLPFAKHFGFMYTNSVISHALDPELSKTWGKIYGEYSAGMVLETDNIKWYLDPKENIFYDKKGISAPKKIQKLLNNDEFIKNLNKGLKYLGEDKIKGDKI
ncbi:hypothetical protein [Clostridium saccharoperbutylacetonicum]